MDLQRGNEPVEVGDGDLMELVVRHPSGVEVRLLHVGERVAQVDQVEDRCFVAEDLDRHRRILHSHR